MAPGAVTCSQCHAPLPADSVACPACGADVRGGVGEDAAPSRLDVALQKRLQRLLKAKYEVRRLLGKGGMGTVFLAYDLALDREVAIKVLPPDLALDDDVVKRFRHEARVAAKLEHPGIIPIHRVESRGGLHYFVMKYLVGTSLEDVLCRRDPHPPEFVQPVLWEAASALGYAHQHGVVHRDVKPANIMFDHDGRVVLTDFGISKALQAGSGGYTGTGTILGTPHYMAPEQAKGALVDGRADQYSLGVIGFRMITGEVPFSGDTVHTILYKHIFEEPPHMAARRPDIPESVAVAISRALCKDPEQRFATMEEFAGAVWPDQPLAPSSPTLRVRARRRTAPQPAAVDVTEAPTMPLAATEAPTALLPTVPGRAWRAARALWPPTKGRGLGAALTLALLGGGLYLALGRTEPSRPAATAPENRAGSAPAEAPSYLAVDADPPARVYVDNADRGLTPAYFAINPGGHTIRLEREGYRPKSETVQVDSGRTVRKRYVLLPEP